MRPQKENFNEKWNKEVSSECRVGYICADSSLENYFDIQGYLGQKGIKKELRGI